MFGDGGGVLAVQRAGQGFGARAGELGVGQQGGGEGGQREVQADAGEAEGAERFGGDEHGFGVGLRGVGAEEFDAGLGDLAVGVEGGAGANAFGGVGQAQRAG